MHDRSWSLARLRRLRTGKLTEGAPSVGGAPSTDRDVLPGEAPICRLDLLAGRGLVENPVDRANDLLSGAVPDVLAGQQRDEGGEADHQREPLDRDLAALAARTDGKSAGETRGLEVAADPER